MNEAEKKIAALRSVEYLQSNTVVGLGSGSTATYAIHAISDEVRRGNLSGLKFVATSSATDQLARKLGLDIIELQDVSRIDCTIDGADEFAPDLSLIKGGGGALVREKIVAFLSDQFIVIVDSGKQVDKLGKFKLPVEVFPFVYAPLMMEFEKRGFNPDLRRISTRQVFISDNGNYIIDLDLTEIQNPFLLKEQLEDIPGIIDHGLFLNYADLVIMGTGKEVLEFRK